MSAYPACTLCREPWEPYWLKNSLCPKCRAMQTPFPSEKRYKGKQMAVGSMPLDAYREWEKRAFPNATRSMCDELDHQESDTSLDRVADRKDALAYAMGVDLAMDAGIEESHVAMLPLIRPPSPTERLLAQSMRSVPPSPISCSSSRPSVPTRWHWAATPLARLADCLTGCSTRIRRFAARMSRS